MFKSPLFTGKLASRKLWVTIFSLVLVVLNEIFNLGINEQAYWYIVGIVAPYLIGQGIADLKQSNNQQEKNIYIQE